MPAWNIGRNWLAGSIRLWNWEH